LLLLFDEGNEQIIKDNENILPRALSSVVVKIFLLAGSWLWYHKQHKFLHGE
jgi:hypothetical protein